MKSGHGSHPMAPPAEAGRVGPGRYASWRASRLGAVTEAVEQRLLLDLVGEPARHRVLDVGCGDGTLVRALAARGADAVGIDPDPAMLAAARAHTAAAGVHGQFAAGRMERLPFPDGSFDVVIAVTSLCFVADAAAAMREMARAARPGGRLVVGELGRWSVWAAARRCRGWLGNPTWQAAHFRTATGLCGLARQAGLSVVSLRGAVFYPPVGLLAWMLARADPWLGRLTTFGAAFIALAATTPDHDRKE